MDLILFMKTGVTHRFQQVTNFIIGEHEVTFEYEGVSTQTHRKAKFYRENISGYSIVD